MFQKTLASITAMLLSLVALLSGKPLEKILIPLPLDYPICLICATEDRGMTVTAEDTDSVTLQKQTAGTFKVLFYTDQHLDGKNYSGDLTVDRMIRTIQHEQPDLVLLGGDNITNGLNCLRCHQFAWIFEKLGVYWGGTLGNHEGDNQLSVTREKMVDIFSAYPHCIMRKGPDDIDGNCNYAINLLDAEGQHIQTIFCLDTFDELTQEQIEAYGVDTDRSPYDGAHANQVQWYREKAAALKAEFGDYKSILLQHIPLPAYDRAAEVGDFLFGDKREGICSTVYENGLFDAIKESGTTQAVFCGHDHLNNFGAMYDGILLAYLQPSGYGAYGLQRQNAPKQDWLQGYSSLQFNADGTFEYNQFRYAEVFSD
ncbi:MAG: metallophosphoesterase [Clostridia bacterium]|nr:metallophosphoesterase [Clostridia bacterium]